MQNQNPNSQPQLEEEQAHEEVSLASPPSEAQPPARLRLRLSTLLVLCAIVTALNFVAGLFPFVFFVPLLVVCTLSDLRLSIFAAISFGCVSIIYSLTLTPSPVALAFLAMPIIPFVPRIIAAIGAHYAYRLGVALPFKGKMVVAGAIAAAVGSLLNTVLVVGAILTILPKGAVEYDMIGYAPVMLASGAIEMLVNCALVAPISYALHRSLRHTSIFEEVR